jgi:TonB family protein
MSKAGAQWGIVLALSLVGCAESSQESRPARTAAAEDPGPSAPSPDAISPDRQDAIERLFARKAAELQGCWTAEYEKTHNRKLEGDVTVGMEITPSGNPSNVRVLKSTMNTPTIDSCVQQQVQSWNFPEGQATVPYMRTVHLGAQF